MQHFGASIARRSADRQRTAVDLVWLYVEIHLHAPWIPGKEELTTIIL